MPLNDRLRQLAVVTQPIEALIPDSENPRLHSTRHIRQIARSIETFGFNVPILVDTNFKVIAGHGRLLAARKLGLREVPTICLEHLNEAQRRAFAIADNRLNEVSRWNDQLLAEQLRELSLFDLDFSLDVTGFEMGEIDLRIEGISEAGSGSSAEDEIPPLAATRVSKAGDIWLLGRHRLVCGDSTRAETYAALMESEQAAAVFTDPPYNVRIDGHASGLGKTKHREFAMASGEMSENQFTQFLSTICRFCTQHSRNGSIHYFCMDWRHLRELIEATRPIYSELKNLAVWVKPNAGMGSFYRSQHELVLILKHGRAPHQNNVELGRFGRNRTNVWSYAGGVSFGMKNTDEGDLLALHPTPKPVAMVADAILDCSRRGDIILDPFLGSGTTMMAAQRTGRRCYAIEMDPLYVDTAVRRWRAFTGEDARHAITGLTFTCVENNEGARHDA